MNVLDSDNNSSSYPELLAILVSEMYNNANFHKKGCACVVVVIDFFMHAPL